MNSLRQIIIQIAKSDEWMYLLLGHNDNKDIRVKSVHGVIGF
jgi:hypothetical protein